MWWLEWWFAGSVAYLLIGFGLSFIVFTVERADKSAGWGSLWKESPLLACIVIVGWGVIILIYSIAEIGALARKMVWHFNEK